LQASACYAGASPSTWRPWLDRELSRLPEKYRTAVILCDLEGRTRKEAARQLRVPEGTLSSRLAMARRLLAKRLSRYGLSLSGAVLAEDAASAFVARSLFSSTTKAAVGQASLSRSVEVLVRGAVQTMLMAKLKLAVGAVMVVVALGTSGMVYRASGQSAPAVTERRPDSKPRSELEALRRENELLKLNLEVVLEKVRAQEAELRNVKAQLGQGVKIVGTLADGRHLRWFTGDLGIVWDAQTGKLLSNAEAKPKAGQNAPDKEELRRTVDALEKAVKELREQLKKQESSGK
jgi:hypothetical protein